MSDKYALVRVPIKLDPNGYLKEVWRWSSWIKYKKNIERSSKRLTPAWELIAESEDTAELRALGNLVEGSWVGNYAQYPKK